MKKVFVDTNILLDYILNRQNADNAEKLLILGYEGNVNLYSSFLTFANIAYIACKKVNIYEMFNDLCSYIKVLSMDSVQLHAALLNPVKDFEDMLQYQCAKAADCDIIITNNIKDFEEYSKIPLYTANEFLNSIFVA